MFTIISKNFDPLIAPLRGTSIIEASAGTGKTYALSIIYLRLLLGLRKNTDFPKPLSVEEILVVTFTEIATKEFRNRIRLNIQRLRLACVLNQSNDPFSSSLLEQIEDTNLAAHQLLIAEQKIDKAAIFTIHGFCYRMLYQNKVNSEIPFRKTVIENEKSLLNQVIINFWRRHCYSLPVEVASIIYQNWSGPESLLAELLPYLQDKSIFIINPPNKHESIIMCYWRITDLINKLKQKWINFSEKDLTTISANVLNKKIYNSKNLSNWIKKIKKWAKLPTEDHSAPKEMERFRSSVLSNNTTMGCFPYYPLFEEIDIFYRNNLSLRKLIFVLALKEVRSSLKKEKEKRSEISFDDLLKHFDLALTNKKGKEIAKLVRSCYPIAMIDEFQDTDQQQYRIFSRIYRNQSQCGLILMGDPKQAIYSFRGADIFTYMKAKKEVSNRYTLNINWRSSPNITNAINALFKRLPEPFIFKNIPFLPASSAINNNGMRLIINGSPQKAMHIWLKCDDKTNINNYRSSMVNKCVTTLHNLLISSKNKNAWLENSSGRRPLKASDIAILVRNKTESALIRKALSVLKIPVTYSSNSNSVYKTPEARELMWLLQGVLSPNKDNLLRCALATNLMGLDSVFIDKINTNEQDWDRLVEQFICFRNIWKKKGVLPMIRKLIVVYNIGENILSGTNGERHLTDILHIGELLQEASSYLSSEYALVRWLALKIESIDSTSDTKRSLIENNNDIVHIITIHKSKGLEFPLIFLPFAADFRKNNSPFFHNRHNYQSCLDLNATPESIALAEEERLSEDLRLLYVAVTRSIYHCSIGIAPLVHRVNKKSTENELHCSALGYLIQQKRSGDAKFLYSQLKELINSSNGDIELYSFSETIEQSISLPVKSTTNLSVRVWKFPIWKPRKVTNYSQFNHTNFLSDIELKNKINKNIFSTSQKKRINLIKSYNFFYSILPDSFLHDIFLMSDFTNLSNFNWLEIKLISYGINIKWLHDIQNWIKIVINTKLDGKNLCLANLLPSRKKSVLEFYLPINKIIEKKDIDKICIRYNSLLEIFPLLNFSEINKMLTGFIDLVFLWNNKYYILDYKFNYLGDNSKFYNKESIAKEISLHRYDLQYKLYALALYRYLRYRLKYYDYQKQFGGIYCLFLRGIDEKKPDNGIYFCRPNINLIEEIDQLLNLTKTSK